MTQDRREQARAIVDKGMNQEAFRLEFSNDPVSVLRSHGIGVDAEHEKLVADYLKGEVDQGWFPTSKCSWCKIGFAAIGAAVVAALLASGVGEGAAVEEAAEEGAAEEGVSVSEWIGQHWGRAIDQLDRVPGINRKMAAGILAGMGSLSVGSVIHAICSAIGDC